jgi:hypothetical protein
LFLDQSGGLARQTSAMTPEDFSFAFFFRLSFDALQIMTHGFTDEMGPVAPVLPGAASDSVNAFENIFFNSDRNSFHIIVTITRGAKSGLLRPLRLFL